MLEGRQDSRENEIGFGHKLCERVKAMIFCLQYVVVAYLHGAYADVGSNEYVQPMATSTGKQSQALIDQKGIMRRTII